VSDRLPHRLMARLLARLLALCLVASVGAVLGSSAPALGSGDDQPPARSAQATAVSTLSEAKALFAGRLDARRPARSPHVDATMVLRDLALRVGDLPTAAQRESAKRILARPTTADDPTGGYEPKYTSPSGSTCGPHICVHWVEDATSNSAQGAGVDGNLATIPVWASTTLTTLESVYGKEVSSLGYRAPLSDGVLGGDGRVDVYLADLGGEGLYGYCTTDQPDASASRQVFAYCVVDNDYAAAQFGTMRTPLQDLQVTAAHEFFHAVQFGYDWQEDLWLMEGTAAWMEDEVYDSVNDNLQYLAESPLAFPYVPLDYNSRDYQPYGSWVFWKFLSESAGSGRFDSPRIVRDVWNAAVGPTYSSAALDRVLGARHTSFARVFGTFGTWMRDPALYFSEGRSYRSAPLTGRFTLSRTRPAIARTVVGLSHMTHSFVRFSPSTSLRGAWRVRLSVNMVDLVRGSEARVVVHRRRGAPLAYTIPLDKSGSGTKVVGFSRSSVTDVELDLVDASIRFHCNLGTSESCGGVPYDDRLSARINVRAFR
jgi:hypothetical protein